MFEVFKTLDTPIEWAESGIAVITVILGLGIGNWISSKIYQFIFGFLAISLIVLPVFLIANGNVTTWQNIVFTSLGLGFLFAFLLFPITAIYNMNEKIKKLEESLKIIGNNEE
jgi:hypothetical protein